ncbi:MAG: nickel pincer cofactor biosynthesis protein LarC [Methanomicrobiales archaeon]|nr:nickel pincer cofactor biosynthesis protein LarC [Methanomicrobiales archaeon]
MRILLLDPFHGAAGDMVVGSLLSLGAEGSAVREAMRSVVGEPEIREVKRRGILALQVDTRAGEEERDLEEVLERVASAQASVVAREMAERIFRRIQEAEERIHGPPVHFHQVGADDAVAEVVGACVALDALRVDGVQILPVAVGRGTVRTAHGILPVPAPATAEILRGSSLAMIQGTAEGELCTPTGAAILAEFNTRRINPSGPTRVKAVGYGAGSRNDPESPNVLRSMLLETGMESPPDEVDILETNVDDVTGEILAYTLDRLMEAGARDASVVPLLMKKGRPAHLVRVICDPSRASALAALMATELGTLGIRHMQAVHRFVIERTVTPIEVAIGKDNRIIDVKCSWMDTTLLALKPEYEQCRAWAVDLGLPLRDVIRIVEAAAWSRIPTGGS